MGLNTAPVVGKIRVTQPVANTLVRLQKDAETAKALAIRLEAELLGDDDESKPEPLIDAKIEGDQPELAKPKLQSLPGIREKGSDAVEERIESILGKTAVNGDGDQEQRIKKVRSPRIIVSSF